MYKGNKLTGQYVITYRELRKRFEEWIKGKEKDWLEYYSGRLSEWFIAASDALNSTMKYPKDYNIAYELLQDIKWEHLNRLGIK